MTKTVTKCMWCGSRDLKKFAHRKDGVGILKCNNCGLYMVDSIPDNLEESFYDETYYNASNTNVDTGYAEMYDLMAPAFLLWQDSLIEELNETHEKKNLLEVGCATGNLLEIIDENQKNLNLEGIDLSKYAVDATKAKGIDARVASIETYSAKSKKDIIFSAETMEHLDDLRSFMNGVKANLKADGTFLFYVPSMSEKDAVAGKDGYLRFNTNLEHLLHFTPEFFNKELGKFFDGEVLIKEFITDFGPCIVGAVSKNGDNLVNIKTLFEAIENHAIPPVSSDTFLKNLVIIALKFAEFDLAKIALDVLKTRKSFRKDYLLLLGGLVGYHNGSLLVSNENFEAYLKIHPGNHFVIRSLLTNERELNKLYAHDIEKYRGSFNESQSKIFDLEAELRDYQNSKIVGMAVKLRTVVRIILKFRKKLGNKIKFTTRKLVTSIIPKKLRLALKYVIKLRWLVKKQVVINEKYSSTKPLVSVVIPYFNHGMTVEETLNSLQNQTFTDFEVILVNDGSTMQQSVDKLSHLNFPKLNLTIINQKNQGTAAARNKGVGKSTGKYVVCLDADDTLSETYLEKNLILLETNPNVDISATDMQLFGVKDLIYRQSEYNPFELLNNNMLIHAAMYNKEGWNEVGGYKSGIGYEDWEFWISMAENGYWGKRIPELLFNYRTAVSSRYIDDQAKHKENLHAIKSLHHRYIDKIKKIRRHRYFNEKYLKLDSALVNLGDQSSYALPENDNPNILITIPWMTFGGAETLIYNYCREIKDRYNITFMTGLKAEHEWEYKFKEITDNIYHLDNLFVDKKLYLEFISNYITTRKIDILHIIHNGFTFDMLPELKKRHPKLKVLVTMFNDRVEYFHQSIQYKAYIDTYVSDNCKVSDNYQKQIGSGGQVEVVPNGINCEYEYNPSLFNRREERSGLGITDDEIAIFFVGRFSSEKNPDVFLKMAEQLDSTNKHKSLKFFMIGDGIMKPAIEKKITSIRSDNIRCLGYQSEVAKYLSAGDIFVLPSSIEGFPLSILEAMAMKLVVIASDVGAVSEVIKSGQDGFVVKPGSVADIKSVILKLQKDRKLLEKIKLAARQKLENNYSNTVLRANYVKLYEGVLK